MIAGNQRNIGYYEKYSLDENEEAAATDYARAVFKYKGQDALDKARKRNSSSSSEHAIDLRGVPPQPLVFRSEGHMKEGASKYAGVYFNKKMNRWQARISIGGKQRHIGLYDFQV